MLLVIQSETNTVKKVLYGISSTNSCSQGKEVTLVVCTDLSCKELHRQVDMGVVMTTGSLCGVMVAHWPRMPDIWVKGLL